MFPTRALVAAEKGNYFCDLIITALTFEHIAKNRTVVVRALYTFIILFYEHVGRCMNKYIKYAACSARRSVNAFAQLCPRDRSACRKQFADSRFRTSQFSLSDGHSPKRLSTAHNFDTPTLGIPFAFDYYCYYCVGESKY